MATPNSTFTALVTTTFNDHSKEIKDNVTSHIPIFKFMAAKGRTKTTQGGLKMIEPLRYSLGSTQAWSGYDSLDAQPVDGITAAEYTLKNIATPITISDDEKDQNRGKAQIISLLETKRDGAVLTHADWQEQTFFLDGLGNGGKDPNGLQNLIECDVATATTVAAALVGSGSVGGITRSSTYTFWQNYCAKGTKTTTAGDNLLQAMRNMWFATRRGEDKCDLIVTTDAVAALYETLTVGYMQWTPGQKPDMGIDESDLVFKKAPIKTSYYCPSGYMYFLNTNYLYPRFHADWQNVTTEFKRPTKQMATIGFLVSKYNTVITNSNRQGVIGAIT
jgi:hypothetical protein